MTKKFLHLRTRRGATAVSYGLLLGLIAIACLTALSSLGGRLNDLFGGVNQTFATQNAEEPPLDRADAYPEGSCADGTMTQESADILNSWANKTYTIEEWCALTSLSRNRTNTSTVPAAIAALSNLETLSLSQNNITALPPEMGYLKNLSSLDLRDNLFSTFPPALTHLTGITYLNLGSNDITSLPTEIGSLENLTSLYLNDNKITNFPAGLARLSTLDVLSIHGNQITTLPTNLDGLRMLRVFYIFNNQLESLPESFRQLSHLDDLHIEDNDIDPTTVSDPVCTFIANVRISIRDDDLCPADLYFGVVVE